MPRWKTALLVLVVILAPSIARAQLAAQPAEIKAAPDHPDESDWFELLLAVDAGGGVDSNSQRQPTAYAGLKLGFGCCFTGKHPRETGTTVTLDLGYDRLQSRSGFSTELSFILPILRFPQPGSNDSKNYLRIYAEPGAGFRAGGGEFGGYASAKVLIALLSNRRIFSGKASPILEIQRRLPLSSLLHGDTRLTIGLMAVVCKHCGFD